MATIRRYISDRTDGDGKAEIYLRFSGGRGRVYRLRSGLRVSPARWNAEAGTVVIPRLGTAEQRGLIKLRSRLDELCNLLLERYAMADSEKVDREWFRHIINQFHHPEVESLSEMPFFEVFDRYMQESGLSEMRLRHVEVLRRDLLRFELFSGETLDLSVWTGDTLRNFESFLKNEHIYCSQSRYAYIYEAVSESRVPSKRSRNTLVGKFKQLRAFVNWCGKRRLVSSSPFDDFEMDAEVYGTPYYLTIEERERLAQVNLSRHPHLAVQRDIFVFQCLVGCRVSDLLRMRKSSVIDGAVEYIAKKTAGERPSVIRVPLTESAQEIVDRYADTDDDRLLPFISAQKYNDAIKRVFLAARLTRLVTVLDPLTRQEVRKPLNEIASSHLARRTFIGNLYRQVKDPALVGALSGHADGSRAFARYRTIDEQMKEELVRLLEKKP